MPPGLVFIRWVLRQEPVKHELETFRLGQRAFLSHYIPTDLLSQRLILEGLNVFLLPRLTPSQH